MSKESKKVFVITVTNSANPKSYDIRHSYNVLADNILDAVKMVYEKETITIVSVELFGFIDFDSTEQR